MANADGTTATPEMRDWRPRCADAAYSSNMQSTGQIVSSLPCRHTIKKTPANAEGTTLHKTGIGRAGSTPLLACAQTANASAHSDAGRASHLFLHPLSPGRQIFGCSSAVERLTVNQDVVGSIPTSRARNERKMSGGMPVGVHRLKRTAERPLTNLLSPGPEISRRMPVELHNHLVAGSSPAIAFRDVAQLDRAVENVSPTPCRRG